MVDEDYNLRECVYIINSVVEEWENISGEK